MIVDDQIKKYTEKCSKEDSDMCVDVGRFLRKNYVLYFKLTGILREHYLGLSDLDQRLLLDRINMLLGKEKMESMNRHMGRMMNDPFKRSSLERLLIYINSRYIQEDENDNNV